MLAQPAAFFAPTGYYNTAPGSTLSVVIQPNYYSAIVRPVHSQPDLSPKAENHFSR